MEDAFVVAYQQTKDKSGLEYAYFGIFDGHGGREAALYAKEHLLDAIVKQSGFWSNDDEHVLRAIKHGFLATHLGMWKEVGEFGSFFELLESRWVARSGIALGVCGRRLLARPMMQRARLRKSAISLHCSSRSYIFGAIKAVFSSIPGVLVEMRRARYVGPAHPSLAC